MATVTEWLKSLESIRFNPASIQRLSLSTLDDVLDGKFDIVDASNPFIFLMEASAVNAAAGINENFVLSRQQYPSLAQTENDLYFHMSDKDYLDRFATAATTTFKILLEVEELYSRAVSTSSDGIRKITIPKHTEFTIAQTKFTMQYPIDIKIMSHGGLQIVYDNEQISPIQTLTTNIVEYDYINIESKKFLCITIPIYQMEISSKNEKLNNATVFIKNYTFADQYYYARAFYSDNSGNWIEMYTTHTDQVYDSAKPTAVLSVIDNVLKVTIPQIYLTNKLINTELRIDIYTTKGPININLASYQINNFTANWKDLDSSSISVFTAPLLVFTNIALYSDQLVNGGSDAISFTQLKNNVISNSLGDPNPPISNANLSTVLGNLGYGVVTNVDNVTNRIILATRDLPKPSTVSTSSSTNQSQITIVSGAAATIGTLQAQITDLVNYNSVVNNGNRVTLLPSTLFKLDNGILSIVDNTTIVNFKSLTTDALINNINNNVYLYSPFHYVLDVNNNVFDCRPYYIDNPSCLLKTFIDENDTTGIEVGTGSYKIERNETGYILTVVCNSSSAWKNLSDSDVFCQLSFIPVGEKDRAFLNGKMVGLTNSERTFTFEITSNYDFDKSDNIVLTSFQMYNDGVRNHFSTLTNDFFITYSATNLTTSNITSSIIDNDLGTAILPSGVVGITEEQLKINLGSALTNLWRRNRSIASSQTYQVYESDVPAFYTNTIFAVNPNTGVPIVTIAEDGKTPVYQILHNIGDPILDENGNQIYSHLKGDPYFDPDGNLVLINPRSMIRQFDLFLVEGVYWFVTEETAVTYKKSIPVTINTWLIDDINVVSEKLLEKTTLYYYPEKSIGPISVIVKDGKTTSIDAAQSFVVDYTLTSDVYRNDQLKVNLSNLALTTIYNNLQLTTITANNIISDITSDSGDDIISVSFNGLGGANNLTAITKIDQSTNCSIRKVAVLEADGTIGVRDDVNVSFINHST